MADNGALACELDSNLDPVLSDTALDILFFGESEELGDLLNWEPDCNDQFGQASAVSAVPNKKRGLDNDADSDSPAKRQKQDRETSHSLATDTQTLKPPELVLPPYKIGSKSNDMPHTLRGYNAEKGQDEELDGKAKTLPSSKEISSIAAASIDPTNELCNDTLFEATTTNAGWSLDLEEAIEDALAEGQDDQNALYQIGGSDTVAAGSDILTYEQDEAVASILAQGENDFEASRHPLLSNDIGLDLTDPLSSTSTQPNPHIQACHVEGFNLDDPFLAEGSTNEWDQFLESFSTRVVEEVPPGLADSIQSQSVPVSRQRYPHPSISHCLPLPNPSRSSLSQQNVRRPLQTIQHTNIGSRVIHPRVAALQPRPIARHGISKPMSKMQRPENVWQYLKTHPTAGHRPPGLARNKTWLATSASIGYVPPHRLLQYPKIPPGISPTFLVEGSGDYDLLKAQQGRETRVDDQDGLPPGNPDSLGRVDRIIKSPPPRPTPPVPPQDCEDDGEEDALVDDPLAYIAPSRTRSAGMSMVPKRKYQRRRRQKIQKGKIDQYLESHPSAEASSNPCAKRNPCS